MDQQAIEKIQHRATKLIPDLRHLTYQERLCKLSLPLLYYRCQRGEMIFLYQLTHQYFNIDVSGLFEYQSTSSTRGHRYKTYKPHAKYYSRVQCFTIHSINNWNSLPAYIVDSSSINLFKNFIDLFWMHKHYEFDCTGCSFNP